MPLLKSCFCCSLLQGSIITGVYTSIVYLAAFILELCLILEGENWLNSGKENGPLPLPAYILIVLYFTIVGLSIIMLYALYQRRLGVLLAWVFIFTLLFFPELGIVLFLVIFHWGLQNAYGIAEIAFYIVRAPVNVMCILCVHSLHSLWRDEISTERTLKKLSTLQMMKDNAAQTSYKNSGYWSSLTDVTSLRSLPVRGNVNETLSQYGSKWGVLQNGTISKVPSSINSFALSKEPGLARRYSTSSQYSDYMETYPKEQLLGDPMQNYKVAYPASWDPLFVENRFQIPDSRSEFHASLFPMHRSLGSLPIIGHATNEHTILHHPKMEVTSNQAMGRYNSSLNYTHPSYEYYEFGTMSRSLLDPEYSLGYRPSMMHADFSTQSLDRRRYMRRAHSFSSDPYSPNDGLRSLPQVYYGYSHRESKSSLGAESDDFRKYRDVAL